MASNRRQFSFDPSCNVLRARVAIRVSAKQTIAAGELLPKDFVQAMGPRRLANLWEIGRIDMEDAPAKKRGRPRKTKNNAPDLGGAGEPDRKNGAPSDDKRDESADSNNAG